MNKMEKFFIALSLVLAFIFAIPEGSYAMHIMEGYLPVGWCLFWGALSLPFLVIGIIKINKLARENRKALILFAMVGAFVFVVSALKFPSLTGSSSHPTGTGLGAVLFGAFPMALIGVIVLLFQALLLAHGGLTTLGANAFSMAVAGPLISFAVYSLCNKIKLNKSFSVFLAVTLGDLFTYCITSLQLALAHPSPVGGVTASLWEFMTVFAVTQIPISIIDGLLAVIVIIGMESYARQELSMIGYFVKEERVRI